MVAEGFMEHREFADGACNQVGLLRGIARIEVGLRGHREFSGGVRVRGQYSLAADDDHDLFVNDGPARPENVLKLAPKHDGS